MIQERVCSFTLHCILHMEIEAVRMCDVLGSVASSHGDRSGEGECCTGEGV